MNYVSVHEVKKIYPLISLKEIASLASPLHNLSKVFTKSLFFVTREKGKRKEKERERERAREKCEPKLFEIVL